MFSVWQCIRDQHDWRLITLAGLVCSLACFAAVTILRQQRGEDRNIDLRWRMVAGISAGFGIWCTHFVAMLGYQSGVVVGYDFGLTLISLVIAIGMINLGFALASQSGASTLRMICGGTIVGSGVALMHYVGMSAVEFPGHFVWMPAGVFFSVIFAITFSIPALMLTLRRRSWLSGLMAGAALMLAILSLHFTGMAAVGVVPDAILAPPRHFLSPMQLGVVIGTLALAVLLISAIAALINALAITAIQARGREFRILVEGITDCALYMLDRDGRVASWNAGAQRLKGLTSQEAIGLHFSSFYSAADRAANLPERALAEALATGKFIAEGWRYRKDGSRFWANVTMEPVIDDSGEMIGFAKITRDISRQKEDQDRLIATGAKLDAALNNMHQGLVLYDRDHRVVLVNARFRTMYSIQDGTTLEGLSIEELMRAALIARTGLTISEERVEAGIGWMRACLAQPDGGTVPINYEDGTVVDLSYRALPDGGVVATFEDVSERYRSEKRISYMALHDDLTTLPNRLNFSEHLDVVLRRSVSDGSHIGIVAIDLDGFKEINDTHGHGTGDLVLYELGRRLGAVQGQGEMIARFGGDEFAAYCIYQDEAELQAFVARLTALFDEPIDADGIDIKLGASLGVAVFPEDGRDREQLTANADLAMYRAKGQHGVDVCRYEHGMDENARLRRAMGKDLREAIARDELSLAFQAQRSVTSGEVMGYEALLRWHHPTNGWISPDVFIPIAEESGSIVEIGEWVLRRAAEAAVAWPEPYRVAVNLSPVQFTHRDLPTALTSILLETGLPPSRLELEITETAIIADKNAALHTLRQIKALGVTIAIDDFGTGYSSLETLNSFPFDKIKIDRSFVLSSDRSEQSRAIIRAVIALGESLKMPVLAEGVENQGQLEFLRAEGCAEAQGYLLGRPSFEIQDGEIAA